jgi:undecaprenyl-diphosphatase
MTYIESVILGIIQGITEFIPVSSSGHLLLAHNALGTNGGTLSFDVALHVGTLLALLLFFRSDVYSLAKNIFSKSSQGSLARLLVAATIPAGMAGLVFSSFIEDNLRSNIVVAASLASVGLLMLAAERFQTRSDGEEEDITIPQGMRIGFAQVLALIPGVSRSGITITAGFFSGLNRLQAARFSFLLAIPIIAGSAIGILAKGDLESSANGPLLAGIAAAFISGLIAIKFMLHVIAKVGLKPFAYYRIALAIIVLVFFV